VVSIEDPIESELPGVRQMKVSTRAGRTLASTVGWALCADPDVILVDEARDSETARLLAEAATTSHLVLAGLDAAGAASAPFRLLRMGVPADLVASSLVCVVGQRLIRRLCAACRQQYRPEQSELDLLDLAPGAGTADVVLSRPIGCPECAGSGHRDVLAVAELITITRELRELIRRHASLEEFARAARATGGLSMAADGAAKALAGLIDVYELVRAGLAGHQLATSPPAR
jgi:type II secretory ATPase GspE/PulE/Tfp pilus assembly ATPase PilB-like protein